MGRSREPALGARPGPPWWRGASPDPELVPELYVQQGRTERQIAVDLSVDLSVSRARLAAAVPEGTVHHQRGRRQA